SLGDVGPDELPPPPQESRKIRSTPRLRVARRWRERRPTRRPAKSNEPKSRRSEVRVEARWVCVGAVVLMESVVLPLPVRDAGESEHLVSVSDDGTEQVKFTVPEKPPAGASAMEAVPLPPGAEMVMS